ncbi:MAG: hypothetical protein ACK4NR_09025 [Micavibrio sp.]
MKSVIFFSAFCLSLGLPQIANANAEKFLTEESVMAVLQQSATAPTLEFADYEAFVRNTTHKTYVGKMNVTVTRDGETKPSSSQTHGYNEIINGTRHAYDSVQNAYIEQSVHEIKLTPDAQKATVVHDLLVEDQRMNPEDVDAAPIMSDSYTKCQDDFIFTPGIGPQIIRSDCTMNVTFK